MSFTTSLMSVRDILLSAKFTRMTSPFFSPVYALRLPSAAAALCCPAAGVVASPAAFVRAALRFVRKRVFCSRRSMRLCCAMLMRLVFSRFIVCASSAENIRNVPLPVSFRQRPFLSSYQCPYSSPFKTTSTMVPSSVLTVFRTRFAGMAQSIVLVMTSSRSVYSLLSKSVFLAFSCVRGFLSPLR